MTGIVTEILDAQGVLQPGEKGFWKVWGARIYNIRAGDLLMFKGRDGTTQECQVESVDHTEIVCPKVVATDGREFRLGALMPIILLRQETHNILA